LSARIGFASLSAIGLRPDPFRTQCTGAEGRWVPELAVTVRDDFLKAEPFRAKRADKWRPEGP
jgi:hypothetical protein